MPWRHCAQHLSRRRRHVLLLVGLVGLVVWGLYTSVRSLPTVPSRVPQRSRRRRASHVQQSGDAATHAPRNEYLLRGVTHSVYDGSETTKQHFAERRSRIDQGACVDLNGTKQPRLEVVRRVAEASLAHPASASAASAAFITACGSVLWHEADARAYIQSNWHAGAPTGTSCADLRRVGRNFDGGKMVCFPLVPCRVVSVGSNMELSFERSILEHAPDCEVDVYDGTLNTSQAAEVQRELDEIAPGGNARFLRQMFTKTTWQRYETVTEGVALLKMDCDGCEWEALPAFVDNVLTAQLVVEVHGCLESSNPNTEEADLGHEYTQGSGLPRGLGHELGTDHSLGTPQPASRYLTTPTSHAIAVNRTHALMQRLEEAGFRIFFAEPNVQYSDGTCVEYSLLRSVVGARRT